MSTELITAEELGVTLHSAAWTILDWRRKGIITAEVAVGKTILFDREKVLAELAEKARVKSKKRNRKPKLSAPFSDS